MRIILSLTSPVRCQDKSAKIDRCLYQLSPTFQRHQLCVLQWKVSLIHTLMIDRDLQRITCNNSNTVILSLSPSPSLHMLVSLSRWWSAVRVCFVLLFVADHSDSWEERCTIRYQVRGRLKSHSFNGHNGWEREIKSFIALSQVECCLLPLVSLRCPSPANWFTAAAELGWLSLSLSPFCAPPTPQLSHVTCSWRLLDDSTDSLTHSKDSIRADA